MGFLDGVQLLANVDVESDPLFGGLVDEAVTNPAEDLLRRCVAAAQQVHRRGEAPSAELLHRVDPAIPTVQAQLVLRTVRFRESMREFGVELDQQGLTPEQQAFLATFFAPEMWQRPESTRLRAAGVTQRQFQGWLKQPVFALEFETWQEEIFASAKASAQTALMAAVDEQKAWAVKLVLAKTHFYDPAGQAAEMHQLLGVILSILDDELRGPQFAGIMKRIGDRAYAVVPDLVSGLSDRASYQRQEPLVLEPTPPAPAPEVPSLEDILAATDESPAPDDGPGASLSGVWAVDLSKPVRTPPRP